MFVPRQLLNTFDFYKKDDKVAQLLVQVLVPFHFKKWKKNEGFFFIFTDESQYTDRH